MPEVLPPLYQRWIEQLLPDGIPSETRATCGTCAMLAHGDASDNDITFNPATKCCTYHPDMTNFMVGRILGDDRPENYVGRRTIERRIAARVAVTPLGISPLPIYQVTYSNSALVGPDVFGRSEALKCPFYLQESGQCGIWLHREAVCSTFFCKYSRGPSGRVFWRSLTAFLNQLEFTLRVWALDQIDPSGTLSEINIAVEGKRSARRGIDHAGLSQTVEPAVYAGMWGPFAGHEAELYKACAAHVARLDLAQAMEVGGAQALIGARTVKRLHEKLKAGLPERVARGHGHLIQLGRGPGKVRLKSTSAVYDFVDVPAAALGAATRLMDRPLADARAELHAEGIELDDETIRWLLDFEVLVPA